MSYIQVSTVIPLNRDRVFRLMSDPEHLIEAWEGEVKVEDLGGLKEYKKGDEVHLQMTRFGVSQSLNLLVEELVAPSSLSLRQMNGPFKHWIQKTKFEDHSEGHTLVTETVDYALPMGLLGHLLDDLLVRAELTRLLEMRLKKLHEAQ